MSQYTSAGVSPRSILIAGVSAAIVGAAAVTPVSVPDFSPAKIASAVEMASITTPLEDAIKNTYNVVEPWAAYGAELTQYVLGFIPGLWWVAPGVDLAYFTIEPLVQAGVYTLADVIGLNFAQIGPDISTGVETSISNAVTYGLAWLNSLVPLPPLPPFPPFPGAAVDAGTVSVPAAAAVQTAALEADATIAGTSEAPVEKAAPVLEAVPAEAAPVTEAETEAPAAPAEDAPAADAAAPAVQAPAVEVEAVEATAETDVAAEAEVAAEVSAPAEAPGVDDQAAETAAPADSPTASGADTSDNTERPSRAARSATRG
jgi:hypothetical protein